MSLLAGLATQNDVLETEKDSVGFSGPIDSALYPLEVTMAYLIKSAKGALGLVTHFKATMPDGGSRDLRQTEYVTSGDAKGNKKFYVKDGQNFPLPGYSWGNSLCLLAGGAPLDTFETAAKDIKVWDSATKAEVIQTKEVLVGLIGKTVLAGVLRQTVDKNVKDAQGNYVPSGETRDENLIDKFFHPTNRKTVAEILAQDGAESGVFVETWADKFTDSNKDLSTKGAVAPVAAGNSFGEQTAAAAPQVTDSLFTT